MLKPKLCKLQWLMKSCTTLRYKMLLTYAAWGQHAAASQHMFKNMALHSAMFKNSINNPAIVIRKIKGPIFHCTKSSFLSLGMRTVSSYLWLKISLVQKWSGVGITSNMVKFAHNIKLYKISPTTWRKQWDKGMSSTFCGLFRAIWLANIKTGCLTRLPVAQSLKAN